MKAKINKVTVRLVREPLLSTGAAAIVHATDTNLSFEPELAARAGLDVVRECAAIGWCDVGSAVLTGAGNLPAEKIIHVVAPRWGEGSERGKLASVTWECLRLAEANGLKSIAMPAISTGSLGYPVENCAKTMLTQIIDFTFEPLKRLRAIYLCLPDPLAYAAFQGEFERQLDELRQSGETQV